MRKLTANFANPLVLWHDQGAVTREPIHGTHTIALIPLGHAVPKLDVQQMEQAEAFLVQQMVSSPHTHSKL